MIIIKKVIILLCLSLSLIFIYFSCNSIDFDLYNDINLNIAVIGEIPKVREDIVKFTHITFDDLIIQNTFTQYDAIFITKDNFSEASQDKYVPIYEDSPIPFFFIDNPKAHIPFVNKDLSYEEVPDDMTRAYATGLIYTNSDKLKCWEYGLYNNTRNKENIEDVYSRIFKTIAENK